jgi:hypothetical protein
MAVKAVADRGLNHAARSSLFRVRCPSSTIVVMCTRYRLSGAEEVVGLFEAARLFES